jgi:hypothetical protein
MPDVPDLSRSAVPLDADKILEQIFVQSGILCSNCGGVIKDPVPEVADLPVGFDGTVELRSPEPAGYEYLLVEPGFREAGLPGAQVTKMILCTRAECEDARKEADLHCQARRAARPWEILDTSFRPDA